ncbi:hypothetical protein G6F65_016200 [Rhizopus arrhizus]|nr:hypothetical protein G6F65_016200 [Rhizopus arrhizus]
MVFAFAPIVGLLLGLSAITVPWNTLLVSVGLYIVIPVILAQLWRRALLRRGQDAFEAALARIGPFSMAALLLTLVLLFAFQGEAIIGQPLVIAMLAVPILIQVLFYSGLAYWLNRRVGEKHSIACPSALIGASNFFELSVAAAISLFGFQSGAALATVVGVLIEVPVMLLVVRVPVAGAPVRVVGTLGTAQTLAWASSYYLPAMLAAPMADDLGVPTPTVYAAFSGAMVVSALVGPWAGLAIDRHGGRIVLVGTSLMFALGLAMLGSAQSLWAMVAAWLILGLAMGAGLYEAAFSSLVRLYGHHARGAITGITLIAGFASTHALVGRACIY